LLLISFILAQNKSEKYDTMNGVACQQEIHSFLGRHVVGWLIRVQRGNKIVTVDIVRYLTRGYGTLDPDALSWAMRKVGNVMFD
jgi:hypothetical protein